MGRLTTEWTGWQRCFSGPEQKGVHRRCGQYEQAGVLPNAAKSVELSPHSREKKEGKSMELKMDEFTTELMKLTFSAIRQMEASNRG